jgi:hypothetical protein
LSALDASRNGKTKLPFFFLCFGLQLLRFFSARFAYSFIHKEIARARNWIKVLKRLPKVGVISNDEQGRKLLKQILQGTGQA